MTTAIAEYSKTEAALQQLRERYGATVWVVDTPGRMASAKESRKEIRDCVKSLESARVTTKADALAHCRLVDGEAKRIKTELLAILEPVDLAIKEVEQAKKREEEAKARAEEERVAKARAEIERIRNIPVELFGKPTEDIIEEADILEDLDLSWTAEFSGVAACARNDAVGKLRSMHKEAVAREEEQARIDAEREELNKLRAEQMDRDRVELEKRAAEDKERRAKLEAEEKESRERIAAQEREAREARELADAEARKDREDKEALLKAERERLEADQRALEAIEREEERRRVFVSDGREMLQLFVDRYSGVGEFSPVVTVISAFLERNEV